MRKKIHSATTGISSSPWIGFLSAAFWSVYRLEMAEDKWSTIPWSFYAISMIVDQGFETMEGASGDDWISVAQSMRAYLANAELKLDALRVIVAT